MSSDWLHVSSADYTRATRRVRLRLLTGFGHAERVLVLQVADRANVRLLGNYVLISLLPFGAQQICDPLRAILQNRYHFNITFPADTTRERRTLGGVGNALEPPYL